MSRLLAFTARNSAGNLIAVQVREGESTAVVKVEGGEARRVKLPPLAGQFTPRLIDWLEQVSEQ